MTMKMPILINMKMMVMVVMIIMHDYTGKSRLQVVIMIVTIVIMGAMVVMIMMMSIFFYWRKVMLSFRVKIQFTLSNPYYRKLRLQ